MKWALLLLALAACATESPRVRLHPRHDGLRLRERGAGVHALWCGNDLSESALPSR
jgi:hypothetical protein